MSVPQGADVSRRAVLSGFAGMATLAGLTACTYPSPSRVKTQPRTLPEDHGAIGDGVADDTRALRAALGAGGILYLSQRYRVTGSLPVAGTGCAGIFLRAGAELIKDYAASFLSNDALVCNSTSAAAWPKMVGPFFIGGTGRIITRDHATNTGPIVALYCDDVTLLDFTVDGYNGKCFMLAGDRMRLSGLTVVNPIDAAGIAGIRYVGGTDFRATGCDINSGDDALQLNPTIGGADPMPQDLSIHNSWYKDCTGSSSFARFIVACENSSLTSVANMTGSITNSGFIGCAGKGNRRGMVIMNSNSTGTVDVLVKDCSLDMLNGQGQNAVQITTNDLATGAASVGALRAAISNLIVHNPTQTTSTVDIVGTSAANVDYVEMVDCELPGASAQQQIIRSYNCNTLRVRGGVLDMTGMAAGDTAGITLGDSPARSQVEADLDGVEIRNIPDAATSRGVWAKALERGVVQNCQMSSAVGATAGQAVFIAADVTDLHIENNDLSGVAGTAKVVDTAHSTAGIVIRQNRE